MLVIRSTKKLLKDMKIDKIITPIAISDPFFSWHANLVLVNRRKHVVFVNDLTRLSLTIPGIRSTQYKNLENIFKEHLKSYLLFENIDDSKINEYLNGCHEAIYTTTNNRSILGTLNDIVFIMKDIGREFDDCNDLNRWNNYRIFKTIDSNNTQRYLKPIELFNKELDEQYKVLDRDV
ncbi:DUF6933 domain-containing protein [Paenibacillus sp. An7]|uniref:DUF6933 domain-containing protein n=1 Tax=Paenibacillus sp. An7 TaxID=2689577 RepID=UPI00135CC5A1|nr:hypothetical protein [Paenibacillus sp. An7]